MDFNEMKLDVGDVAVKIRWITDEDWDFADADTQYLTHGLHPYPARMVPQIAQRLIQRYSREGDVVLDPFCGSGGVLVEARLLGRNSIGIDINPLAVLLATVKSTPIDPEVLRSYWAKLKPEIASEIALFRAGKIGFKPPFFGANIMYWFKPEVIRELAIIRENIKAIEDDSVRRFFEVPFSLTVRDSSGVRKKEYKLYRIPEEEWRKFRPDTLAIFIEHVEESIEKMEGFYARAAKDVFSKVFLADTRYMLTQRFPKEANELLGARPPRIIVTSPPYGDSRTTVAYGQFSRLSSLWLDFDPLFKRYLVLNVDSLSLGGDSSSIKIRLSDFPTLSQTIELIKKSDPERALEVLRFFSDLYQTLERMYVALDNMGYACIVIANRTVRRVPIPTHLIIVEMGVKLGFESEATIIPRRIVKKRIPWENAPENIPGLKGRTMSEENIIIMRKSDRN